MSRTESHCLAIDHRNEIGILRQLECIMSDSTQAYDEFAAHYDQIFESWEASIVRQATVLGGILQHECGDRQPIRVLDCACGIGTQSLGLAMKGFNVEGCDISSGAVERARFEALKRGLSVPFSVANILKLTAVGRSSFDAVICMDNSLPHLETDGELLQAAQQAYGKLRPGGSFIGSIRDYDRFVVEKPTIQGPGFYSDDGRRRIVFQKLGLGRRATLSLPSVHHARPRICVADVAFHLDLSCSSSERAATDFGAGG